MILQLALKRPEVARGWAGVSACQVQAWPWPAAH